MGEVKEEAGEEAAEEVGGAAEAPARGVPTHVTREEEKNFAAEGVAGRIASKEAGEVARKVA